MLLDPLVESALDVEVFNHRFDYQIAVFQFRQVVFEIPDGNEGSAITGEESVGFSFLCSFETGPRDCIAVRRLRPPFRLVFRNNIEEKRGHTRVGKVCSDLRAHCSRAENGSFFDLNHGGKIILNEHSFSKLPCSVFSSSPELKRPESKHESS